MIPAAARDPAAAAHLSPKLSTGRHYLTILFGLWLIFGIFIDGFAHNHGVVETFFTPWHAILYSGFLASAIWMSWLIYRAKRGGAATWREAIPEGYGLGLAGVAIFLLGGVGDMTWHVIFGIEKGIEALLSPTHLMLLVGGVLIVSSPFRAAWRQREVTMPGWGDFLPPFLSLLFALAAAAFFLMYAWMFRYNLPAQTNVDWYWTRFYSEHIREANEVRGLSYFLIDTWLFMLPLFLFMKRWRTPFGTATLLFALLTVLMNVLDGFEYALSIIVAAIGGLAADVLIRWLRPSGRRLWAHRIVALAAPIVLWGVYFAGMGIVDGIGWSVEMWSGAIVLSALASLALNVLAFTPSTHGDGEHA